MQGGSMKVDAIWWRRVTPNDYFNIEKFVPSGPKGQIHVDVPNPAALLNFFNRYVDPDPSRWTDITIRVSVIWDPTVSSELTFRPRPKNNRYDIRRQNHYTEDSERHPAWTSNFGWPTLEEPPESSSDAGEIVAPGITIYVVRTIDSQYFAGFTRGKELPAGWPTELQPLFSDTKSAGLIEISPTDIGDLAPFIAPISPITSISPGGDTTTVESIVAKKNPKPGSPLRSGGQGYGLNAAERLAVERLAMDKALAFFEAAGYEEVTDVGSVKPYDISMKKAGQEYIVEVKGTTSGGESIFLTKNEVQVHRERHPHNFLFVVSNIKLVRSDTPIAVHGDEAVTPSWDIKEDALTPVTYSYSVLK